MHLLYIGTTSGAPRKSHKRVFPLSEVKITRQTNSPLLNSQIEVFCINTMVAPARLHRFEIESMLSYLLKKKIRKPITLGNLSLPVMPGC